MSIPTQPRVDLEGGGATTEKTSNRRGISRSPRTTYHFRRSPQFDFFLQWLVGAQSSAAAEAGECFFAASQIRDGDLESWVASWRSLGRRAEARADECAARGHVVSAREAYLRAYTYHRAPLLFMNP